MLLDNPFNDERVSNLRLLQFAQNAREALRDSYPDLSTLVGSKAERFVGSLGGIEKARAEGKSSSKALHDYKARLHAFLKQHNDAFSVALGGRESMAFLSFFPEGLRAYARLTHTEAPAVLDRLQKSFAEYGGQLPEAIRNSLQPLLAEWTQLRSSQQYLLETIDSKRVDRSTERVELELALLKAVHTVALDHLGDAEKARAYFKVGMLEGRRRKKEANG